MRLQLHLTPVPGTLAAHPEAGGLFGADWSVGSAPLMQSSAGGSDLSSLQKQMVELKQALGAIAQQCTQPGRMQEPIIQEIPQTACTLCYSNKHMTDKCSFFTAARGAAKKAQADRVAKERAERAAKADASASDDAAGH